MDGIIGWIQIGWALELAWFASWPGWLQIGGVVVVVFAAITLLCWAAFAVVNAAQWLMGRRGKRMTLAEKQAERAAAEAMANGLTENEVDALVEGPLMPEFERLFAAAWRGEGVSE